MVLRQPFSRDSANARDFRIRLNSVISSYSSRSRWFEYLVFASGSGDCSSDLPVKSITRHEDKFTVTTGRLGWPNTEIFLAISKQLMLHGRFSVPRVSPLTPSAVRDFNFATAWDSTRVFSSEPTIEGLDLGAPTNTSRA